MLKWIDKYERYISDDGHVYRKDKSGNIVECSLSMFGVKGKIQYKGFRYGHRPNLKQEKVHRAVAEAFIPNPDGKPTVDHIDRDPLNNTVNNLRWATWYEQAENRSTTINRMPSSARSKDDPTKWRRETQFYKKFISLLESHKTLHNGIPCWVHKIENNYRIQRRSKYHP